MPAVKCAGRVNIPDGEIFTAPVRDSVNGVIAYNTPSTHDGFSYENMRLTFREGRIVDVPLEDAASRTKFLPTDHPLIQTARDVGIFFGD